jgi:hypothetical protein
VLLCYNKILCRYFIIEQNWTVFSRETITNWRRASGLKREPKKESNFLKIFVEL